MTKFYKKSIGVIQKYSRKLKIFVFNFARKINKTFDFIVMEVKGSVDFENMNNQQIRTFILSFFIVTLSSVFLVHQYFYAKYLSQVDTEKKTEQEIRKEFLEKKIRKEVAGHPIELMAPYIAQENENTAAYLIGIAKKESNWGKRRPVLNGQDCFNYWGYRGVSEKMGSGGHTCFETPSQAVRIVANRIDELIRSYEVDSANDLVVWKCGYSCESHSNESVRKWISDVDYYSRKILN